MIKKRKGQGDPVLFEKTTYSDDFPLSIQIVQVEEFPFHYHQDVELVYVLKGEIRLKNGYYNYQLREGDIFTNSGHEVHALYAVSPENMVAVIQISNRFFTQYFPQLPKACFRTYTNDDKYGRQEQLRGMLLHILLDYTRRNFNYKSTCIYQMIDTIKYLNQYFNLFAFEDRVVVNFKNDNPVIVERISHIINYVYENYANRITLEDLAEKEHLSTYYLSHLIHEYMGISFQKFLCFARSEMSEIPLLETDQKISAVARMVGFSTTAYYEKFFREWFGHSPQEHRDLFHDHVFCEQNPHRFQTLPESQITSLLLRRLASRTDHEISPAIRHTQLNVLVDPAAPVLLELNRSFIAIVSTEDYHVMGEHLFHLLYQLNIAKVMLLPSTNDTESSLALIANRFHFMGYEVLPSTILPVPAHTSAGYDSIAAAIHIFRTFFTFSDQTNFLRLRDPGDPKQILKGFPACLTSCAVPKPSFYAYQLLHNMKGQLLYQEKYYYIIKNIEDCVPVYTIIVLNYNDKLVHLSGKSTDVYEVNNCINSFMDELNIDITIPVVPGDYLIAKYAFSNQNSIFMHMAHLHFPDRFPFQEKWLHLLNTEPQTQIGIETVDDALHLNASIHGAGITVIVAKPKEEELS